MHVRSRIDGVLLRDIAEINRFIDHGQDGFKGLLGVHSLDGVWFDFPIGSLGSSERLAHIVDHDTERNNTAVITKEIRM